LLEPKSHYEPRRTRRGAKKKNFNFAEKGIDFLSQGVVSIILPVEPAMFTKEEHPGWQAK
jgi:hypothetical protein